MSQAGDTLSQGTADPATPGARDAGGTARPCIQVLFHPDLRRIGDYYPLESDSLEVGRLTPIWIGGSSSARALLDPCISREQLTLSWSAETEQFRVCGASSARRQLSLLQPNGTLEAFTERALPPGSVLALGDRILLGLELRDLDDGPPGELLGSSAAMCELRRLVRALSGNDEIVLVTGDTGTGKELVARALHALGPRAAGPFIAVNCAALPEQLLESELFGHERGAFTGAATTRSGLFRAAEGGTLFLDELAELSPSAQAKLLRVLQERSVRAVGREHERPVDVRVVAATNRSLSQAVAAGHFRLDLLSRIDGLCVHVPNLAARRSDVPTLFVHFLQKALAAQAGAQRFDLFCDATSAPPPVPFHYFCDLLTGEWPGNVRQLERLALAVATLSAANQRFVAPASNRLPEGTERQPDKRRRPSRDELLVVLEANDFIQNRVASVLGVPQATLARWVREDGIVRPRELTRSQIEEALGADGGDLAAAARRLRVSARGLRLRLTELGLKSQSPRRP